MSQTFTDENLISWEAFATSGDFGFAERPRIVFNCLSNPDVPARYVEAPGDEADAEGQVRSYDEYQLRELLARSQPVD
jgi:hypothetical protein